MLAPVLARLSSIPGVVDARVECSGTHFLVTGADLAALERALPLVADVLGPTARRVEGARRESQLARHGRGEPWFSGADIRALSYVEGRMLSTRMADAVAATVSLEREAAEQVLYATRDEILAALDHAHDTGGRAESGWFWEEWPRIVERISARLTGALPAAERDAVARTLLAQAPSRRG